MYMACGDIMHLVPSYFLINHSIFGVHNLIERIYKSLHICLFFVGIVCPVDFTLASNDICYRAMDVNVTYWKGVDVCTSIQGTAGMSAGYSTEYQALR